MGVSPRTIERMRIAIYHLVAKATYYQGGSRRVTAMQLVPHIMAADNCSKDAALKTIASAKIYGYIEDDTDIPASHERRSRPIHATEQGIKLLGPWHPSAVADGLRRHNHETEHITRPPGCEQE